MAASEDQGKQEPPRDFDGLRRLLIERRDGMPARLVQVAEFALGQPDEIAFGTVAQIAEAAMVQPSTLVRFAQALGFRGFSDLQQVFRDRLRDRWPDYRERLTHLREHEASGGAAGLLRKFTDSAALSLGRLHETVTPVDLERAVDLLGEADIIYLLGLRRAFPVAAYLSYAFGKLGVRCVLLDHVGAMAGEQLSTARPGDALVAVSFTPYTTTTVELANAFAAKGLPVLAITDSPFSPLAPSATVSLEVVEADLGGFRSFAATFSLAITLAVAVGENRSGSPA